MTRILIVDDELNALRALKEILSSEGYDVRTSDNAQAALTLVAEFRPHLLLTDLRMPGMDGLELIVRAHSLDCSISSVLMSALERPLNCFTPFVKKPISVDRLLETLATVAPA